MIWEAQFLQFLQNFRTPFLDTAMMYISLLGEYGIFCIVLSILFVIFRKTRRTGLEMMLAMLIALIVTNLILKNLIMRVRPYDAYEFLNPLIEKPHDTSFPSGHTTNVFAAATVIFLNHKKTGIVALIAAALVAFSRMYNCVHYPTDVLAGIAVGVICAVLTHYLIYPPCEKRFLRWREKRSKAVQEDE